jgi:uncharacterized membrane protein
MEARPIIKIELTRGDKVLETACITLLVLLWVGTIAFFSKLPDRIPSHYNSAGQADDFSGRTHILVLPTLATVIYIGMTLLNKFPHIFNYAATVNEENAKRLFTAATKLIRVLKLMVVLILSGIVLMTYRTSLASSDGIGAWFLPLAVGLLILPNIIYLLKYSNFRQTSR